MARNNYNFLLSSTFDFNPEDILNRSIQSDLKKKKQQQGKNTRQDYRKNV